MDKENNNKILLYISAILGSAFLVSGGLLLRQMETFLGRYNIVGMLEERPPVAQVYELPLPDGYTLRRNPTEHQIELFELLVNTHDLFNETGLDEDLEKYASAIVRNFVADFFTLSNKNSRQDVGGLQFFSEEIVDNFRNYAIDQFYLYLNQHIAAFGSESLPTVVSTTIKNVDFGIRVIEIEDEDDVNESIAIDHESVILEEEIRIIIIDAEWSYANSTLWYIDEFQTSARFVLVPSEEDVKIYVIEVTENENENIVSL